MAVPVATGVVGVAALAGMRADRAGGYGLVTVVPALGWLALAVLSLSFVAVLVRRPTASVAPVVHLVTLVVLLVGAAPLGEGVARWSISWYTAGFVNQLASTGSVLAHTDARWSWPGFFAGVAALDGPAGVKSATQLLLWTPVALSLAYLAPLISIARSLGRSTRVAWVAAWVFVVGNWTDQNYFAPQGVIFFLFLAVLAVALRYFGHRDSATAPPLWAGRSRWGRARAAVGSLRGRLQREDVAVVATPGQQIGAISIIVVATVASTVSHQLTPVALCLDLASLSVLGRIRLRGLPVLLGAMVALYISYFATDFWEGHLSQLLGVSQAGGASLAQNVGQHIVGQQAHKVVVYTRLLYTLAIWVLAGLGLARGWRRGRADLTAACGFITPLVLPIVQPYGGEALIRAFLYGLPFASVLVAEALCPAAWQAGARAGRRPPRWLHRRAHTGVLAALLVVAVPLSIVCTYGNESFEEVRPGEVAAVAWWYDNVPIGSVLCSVAPDVPGPTRLLADDPWVSIDGPVDAAIVTRTLDARAGTLKFVILTAGEEAYGIVNDGFRPGWEARLQAALLATGRYQVAYANGQATILQYRGPR
ncbi:MAG TPA: hypothetical protein VFP61_12505 [Acidimicrobiales bacterium]|nr:hypothetical protein [Acidimicrobiales bacterium]